jgi:ribokinase
VSAPDQVDHAPQVVVVGSTMIDMIVYVDRVPQAGETVVGNRYVQGFGGKGANQAVMAARLGAAVTMVNCVGDDALGDATVENFRREGIDVTHVTRSSRAGSGVAPIWVEPDGTNRIVCVAGANDDMTPEQARSAVEARRRVDVVVGQFEVPQAVTAAGFGAARDRGAVTVLNPAPAAALAPELAAVTDWLVPNEGELVQVAAAYGISGDRDPRVLVAEVARASGLRLVVTLGPDGVAICEDGDSVVHVPAPVVTAVDTTGAGDAFVGSFAFALAQGLSAVDAARLGCACASASVVREGTQSSFPRSDETGGIRTAARSAAAHDSRLARPATA